MELFWVLQFEQVHCANMSKINTRFRALLQNGNFRGIIGSITIKFGSAASALLLFLLAARVMDDATFGHFTVIFSLASMLTVFAVFGQEMLVIRLWNQYGAKKQYGLLKGTVIFGLAITVVGGLLATLGFGVYLGFTETIDIALSVGIFMFLRALSLFHTHLCRSIVNVRTADGHRGITAMLPANTILFLCLVLGGTIVPQWIFLLLAMGCFLALFFQLRAMLKQRSNMAVIADDAVPQYDIRSWLPPSFRLWFVAILEASNQYLEVILIGFLLSPTAAGIYFVATRLANAFSTAADAFNMFGAKYIPDLFYREEHETLASLLRTMAIMMSLVIIAGLLCFGVGAQLILGLFSKTYVEFSGVLITLCLGTAVWAASGPATQMLMITGHEGRYLKIMATGVFLRIAGFFVLIPVFDIYGAAFANAISLTVIAILVSMSTRLLTGHDPSLLRLVLRPPILAEQSGGA